MTFENITILWLFLGAIPLLLLLINANKKNQQAINYFLVTKYIEAIPRYYRNKIKILLVILSFLVFIMALSRPQYGRKTITIEQKSPDILIAIDISLSMLATDIKPNRLARAKYETTQFVNELVDNRVGLIAFAGSSFLQCPLTTDYATFKFFLSVLEPNLIPNKGTNIEEAIKTALETWEHKSNQVKNLIILTDGENFSNKALALAKKANNQNIRIYTIGIGSDKGAPVLSEKKEYKKDANGNIIISKLNKEFLSKIAKTSNGKYYQVLSSNNELKEALQFIQKENNKENNKNNITIHNELFQFFILLGLLLLFLDTIIKTKYQEN